MEEIWKPYKETYNRRWGKRVYEVSNFGRVKVNGKIKELKPGKNGYIQFMYATYLHRVVTKLFIPNPENKPCVDHIDGNRLNNNTNNLRWVTHKENNSTKIRINNWKTSFCGKVHMNKNGINKFIPKENIEQYLNDGYVFGWIINKTK